jgi:hypothetical protein
LAARCAFWLLVSALLVLLFLFARKRFNQVVLLFGLSTAIIVLFRLLRLRDSDLPELISEAYFLAGIGAVYGLLWLVTRRLRSRRGSPPDGAAGRYGPERPPRRSR